MKKIIYFLFMPILIITLFFYSYPDHIYKNAYNNMAFDADKLNEYSDLDNNYTLNNTRWDRMFVLPAHPEGISKQSIIFFNDSLMLKFNYGVYFDNLFALKYFLGIEEYEYFYTNYYKVKKDSVYILYKDRKTPGRHFEHLENKILFEGFE